MMRLRCSRAARAEVLAMTPAYYARATNRRVIGSMNEFAFHAGVIAAQTPEPLAISLGLAEIPMSAIGEGSGLMGTAREVAVQLLALHAAAGGGH